MNKAPISKEKAVASGQADEFWLACLAQQPAAQSNAGTEAVVPDKRTPLPQDIPYQAALIDQGMRYNAWKIRDMSIGGAFLEMDVTQLQDGAIVEFYLQYNRGGRVVRHQFPAKIIRIQLNGLALRFGYFDEQVRSELISLLYSR